MEEEKKYVAGEIEQESLEATSERQAVKEADTEETSKQLLEEDAAQRDEKIAKMRELIKTIGEIKPRVSSSISNLEIDCRSIQAEDLKNAVPESIRTLYAGKKEAEKEYFDDHEHIVDPERIQTEINEAIRVFQEFSEKYMDEFDLSDDEAIERVLEAAEEKEIFQKAKEIRELIYGRNISIYGVSYISNMCNEKCSFCPMGQSCIKGEAAQAEFKNNPNLTDDEKAALEQVDADYQKHLKTLTIEEAAEDFQNLAKIGHKEICVLSGNGLMVGYSDFIPYVRAALDTEGIEEVVLNTSQFEQEHFQLFMEMLQDGYKIPEDKKLSYRIFQETYDKDEYQNFMRYADEIHKVHGKGNFDVRYNSQIAVLKVTEELKKQGLRGVDEVGIGVLIGLTKNPIKEVMALKEHADLIKEETGVEVKRCCIPFANEPSESGVEIPYKVPGSKHDKKVIELINALARLAMPTVSIVSSERDEEDLLVKLDDYNNHTTLGVRAYPGGNIDAMAELKGEPLRFADKTAQAEVHAREAGKTLNAWKKANRKVIGFDPNRKLSK